MCTFEAGDPEIIWFSRVIHYGSWHPHIFWVADQSFPFNVVNVKVQSTNGPKEALNYWSECGESAVWVKWKEGVLLHLFIPPRTHPKRPFLTQFLINQSSSSSAPTCLLSLSTQKANQVSGLGGLAISICLLRDGKATWIGLLLVTCANDRRESRREAGNSLEMKIKSWTTRIATKSYLIFGKPFFLFEKWCRAFKK